MIKINVKPTVAVVSEPTRMIIISQQKIGKTELCMQLPKSFIIDLENSMQHFSGSPGFNLIKEYASNKYVKVVPKLDENNEKQYDSQSKLLTKTVKVSKIDLILTELPNALREVNAKNGGIPVFDFGIMDTLTEIDDIARILATRNYKKTLIGKNFKGDDVITQLSSGAGYDFHRKAVIEIFEAYEGIFGKCLITNAHIKDIALNKDDATIQIGKELAATGKLRQILPAKWDATGYLYRSDENTNSITFKIAENDKATGARNPHLRNKEFVISKMVNEKIETYWEQIFPSIKNI